MAIQFSAKFERSSTFSNLAMNEDGLMISVRLAEIEKELYKFHEWQLGRQPINKLWNCSTQHALYLRHASWKLKEIVGSTTSSNVEAFKTCYPDTYDGCQSCKEEVQVTGGTNYLICVSDDSSESQSELNWSAGKKTPLHWKWNQGQIRHFSRVHISKRRQSSSKYHSSLEFDRFSFQAGFNCS